MKIGTLVIIVVLFSTSVAGQNSNLLEIKVSFSKAMAATKKDGCLLLMLSENDEKEPPFCTKDSEPYRSKCARWC